MVIFFIECLKNRLVRHRLHPLRTASAAMTNSVRTIFFEGTEAVRMIGETESTAGWMHQDQHTKILGVATKIIVKPHNIIFAQIISKLNFDDGQRPFAGVVKAMLLSDNNFYVGAFFDRNFF